MANLREAQKQLTRRLLLEAALAAFETDGFAGATVDEIASRAGTTRATFYLHFASKIELMQSLIQVVDDHFRATENPTLDSLVENGDPQEILTWLDRTLRTWDDIRSYLLMVHQSDAEPETAAVVDHWHDSLIEGMTASLDRAGRFDPRSRAVRCALAFGQLEGLSRRWMRGGWKVVDRPTALRQLAAQWCYLLAGKDRPSGSSNVSSIQ